MNSVSRLNCFDEHRVSALCSVPEETLLEIMSYCDQADIKSLVTTCHQIALLYYTSVTDAVYAINLSDDNIQRYPNLRDLDLYQERRVTSIGVAKTKNLKKLVFSSPDRDAPDVLSVPISMGLSRLTSLSIVGLFVAVDSSAFSCMPALERLVLIELGFTVSLEHAANLRSLTMINSNVGKGQLKYLTNLRSLKIRALRHAAINIDDELGELSQLTSLSCDGDFGITDAGIKHLSKLEKLKLFGCVNITSGITDRALKFVPALRKLVLGEYKEISGSGFKYIPWLVSLSLIYDQEIGDESLAYLRELQVLKIDTSQGLTGTSLPHPEKLRVLELCDSDIDGSLLRGGLTTLILEGNNEYINSAAISNCTGLKTLSLNSGLDPINIKLVTSKMSLDHLEVNIDLMYVKSIIYAKMCKLELIPFGILDVPKYALIVVYKLARKLGLRRGTRLTLICDNKQWECNAVLYNYVV